MTPNTAQEQERPSGSASGQDATGGNLSRKRRLFRTYEENKRRELKEQREARRYYHSKQWSDEELQELKKRGQPPIFSNRIKRKIDFMVGVEARQRRDPRAYGRTPDDDQAADVATAALRFVTEINRWEELANRVAADGYINGIGVIWCGITRNGRGELDVKLKPVQVDRFFYDSRSNEADFSDSRFCGLHLWFDAEEAKLKWPDKADDIKELMDGGAGETTWVTEQDRDEQWGDHEFQRIRVVEFWEKVDLGDDSGEEGWKYCFFTGDVLLESGWSPYVDADELPDCPYIAWTAYVDEVGDRYGLIRDMKPLQDELNHRRSKFLHILNSRQVHMRDGVVDDVEEFRRQIARPDGVIEHFGTWGTDIGIVDQQVEMQGQAELLNITQAEFENTGPNPGLVGKGAGVAQASGRALLAQRDSGMTELGMVLDRLRDWKLRTYRAIWARIQQAWTEERYIRITDDQDAPSYLGLNVAEPDPETGEEAIVNDVAMIDVDIIMEEGPDMITMQDELLERLSQLGETALTPLGPIMIELSGAPNKDKLIKMLEDAQGIGEPSEEEQQAQDEEDDLARRGQDAEIAKMEADAMLTKARAQEIMAQLQAQIRHLESTTALNEAKTKGEYVDAQASEISTDLSVEGRHWERSNPSFAPVTSRNK